MTSQCRSCPGTTRKNTFIKWTFRTLVVLALVVAGIVTWFWFFYYYPWAQIDSFNANKGPLQCLAFSPDGNLLAIGGSDPSVLVWNLSTRTTQLHLVGHSDRIAAVAFSPNGTLLATASWDGTVRIWEVETGRQLSVLTGQRPRDGDTSRHSVLALTFSSDGRLLTSGSEDGSVRIWEAATAKKLDLLNIKDRIHSVAIAHDNTRLFLRTDTGSVQVWSLPNGKHLRTIEKGRVHTTRFSLALTTDGKTLAYNDYLDEKIKIWDVSNEQMRTGLRARAPFDFQDSWIRCMAIKPDSDILAGTTVFGARIYFWDIQSSQLLTSARFPQDTSTIVFSPNGSVLASAHVDGSVKIWDVTLLVDAR